MYQLLNTEPNSNPGPSSSLHQFQPSWIKQHPWLHYSKYADGAFRQAYVLFAPRQVGGQDLGQFVTAPFTC